MEVLMLNREELEEVIREASQTTVLDAFCNRFANVFIGPEDVTNMYDVHKVTVINYIKDGLIDAEPHSHREQYRIRLSDALKLDFKKLKKQLQFKK